jgi:hypothetical protein
LISLKYRSTSNQWCVYHGNQTKRAWGTVHVSADISIHATPERLAALYLDYAPWSRLIPATIRGVRHLETAPRSVTVEVDHRTEGHVMNIIRPVSPTTIALDEFKPRYSAAFVNRFDTVADGTRYTVDAEVKFHMPYAVIAPLLRGLVRRRVQQFVLEPMRAAGNQDASATITA